MVVLASDKAADGPAIELLQKELGVRLQETVPFCDPSEMSAVSQVPGSAGHPARSPLKKGEELLSDQESPYRLAHLPGVPLSESRPDQERQARR